MQTEQSKTETLAAVASSDLLADWPKTERGNYLCAPNHPMPKNAPGRWEHTGAHEVGEQENGWPGGDIITVECRDCKLRWREELPQ